MRASSHLTRRSLLLLAGAGALGSLALSACGASSSATSTATSSAASSASTKSVASSASSTTSSAAKAAVKTTASSSAPAVAPGTLEVWEPGWGPQSPIDKGYQASLNALAKKSPNLKAAIVTETPFPTKFLTAAAAGTPPDLIFIPPEGGWPQDWAYKKVVLNLDSYIKQAKLSSSDYFTPSWNGSLFKGSQYVLPIEVDPNFPLVYNQSLLQQAGVDKPPATISELDSLNQKLFKENGSVISALGLFPPWMTYGPGNSLTTYFAVFGGGWLDPKDPTKLLMNQPGNVNALTWMKQYANTFGGYAAIQKFAGTWGKNGYVGAMARGFLAMGPMVSANFTQAVSLAKGSEFASSLKLSLMPVAQGVKPDPGWLGGWAMSIPSGVKQPEKSWSVLAWLGGDATGTDIWAEINGFLPGFKKSTYFSKHAKDPDVGVYIKVLEEAYVEVPSLLGWQEIPGSAFSDLLNNSVQGKVDITSALDQFQSVAQAILNKYNKA